MCNLNNMGISLQQSDKYSRCNVCTSENDTLNILFTNAYNSSIVITLCDNCRKETLKELKTEANNENN